MKNFILYYYNIQVTSFFSQDTYFYLETKDDIYYFCKVRKSEEELTTIYETLVNTNYHILIKSKDNHYLVEYNKNRTEKINRMEIAISLFSFLPNLFQSSSSSHVFVTKNLSHLFFVLSME